MGAQCVNGDAIWGRGGKVRVSLELLWSLHPHRYVLHFPNVQANITTRGQMCPCGCQRWSASPCWFLEQDPRGSAVPLSFRSADEAAHWWDVRAPRWAPDGSWWGTETWRGCRRLQPRRIGLLKSRGRLRQGGMRKGALRKSASSLEQSQGKAWKSFRPAS